MKATATRLMLALALCAATAGSSLVLADTTSKQITFAEDVTVDGKLFKKGAYKMEFDHETGELSIINGKTVAKTKARVEKRDSKALRTSVGTARQGDALALRSIAFRGESQSFVVVAAAQQQAEAAQ